MPRKRLTPHLMAAINGQRTARWAAEKAQDEFEKKRNSMREHLRKWAGASKLKFSVICCMRAPADLHCTYDVSYGDMPMRNKCIFCGGVEDDGF